MAYTVRWEAIGLTTTKGEIDMLQDYTQGDIEMILVGVIGNIVRSKWNGDSMPIIEEGVASLEVVIPSQMWMYREAVPLEENIEELRKVMQEVSCGVARGRIDELLVVLLRAIGMQRNGDSQRIDLQAVGYHLTDAQVEEVENEAKAVAYLAAYSWDWVAIDDRADRLAEAVYTMAIAVGCGSWMVSVVGEGSEQYGDVLSMDEMSELVGANVSRFKQFVAMCSTAEQEAKLIAAVDTVGQAFQQHVVSAYLAGCYR